MNKLLQYGTNVLLYGFLAWLLYDSTIKEWDPWFAFVVAFVLLLAIIITVIPAIHAPRVSPGAYPFDD
jgi:ABC-type lipoprotein release transport system permease subunit